MKIAYKHLIHHIESKPTINEISEKLFQLGHEHEIDNDIFNMEFTPNRGDCLSVNGLLRDLALFYDVNLNHDLYEYEIKPLSIDFINNAEDGCAHISFLKIDIEKDVIPYKNSLKNYFSDLKINKTNFFSDISNYISYETGQPTHCYDASKVGDALKLNYIEGDYIFETLLDKKVELKEKNLVFTKGDEIINLAGVMGGKSTSCAHDTKSVIIECAYFNPEKIIGTSLKYNLNSEAAHKFERGVDPISHESVLRRFLKIVEEHATITNVELFHKDYIVYNPVCIPFNIDLINRILGTNISEQESKEYLLKLGFIIEDNNIQVPSHRNDIKTQNDIAEEIARSIGYNNIESKEIIIPASKYKYINDIGHNIKSLLIDNGFYEVINSPFEKRNDNNSIKVDNPLDSNREFLRTDLKQSLIKNLQYNERRQKDSVKLFELSDIYNSSGLINKKKKLGIIASGRVGENYLEFSQKINVDYISSIIKDFIPEEFLKLEVISRDSINSKAKTPIIYFELDCNIIKKNILEYKPLSKPPSYFIKYKEISEYPSSYRDLSFSLDDGSRVKTLENILLSFEAEYLKRVFVFDYFKNPKISTIKVGFRFIFESKISTLTDVEIDKVMLEIINKLTVIDGIDIQGLNPKNIINK
jgi:phenylalanyl-tRNA synthetase beta chain